MKNGFSCLYPCTDIDRNFIFPGIKTDPGKIKAVMISEAPPPDHSDYYYENPSGAFFLTTKTAFQDAGIVIRSYEDLTDLGFYLTTAIKCGKKDYLVSVKTIKECAKRFLSKEIFQFPCLKVILCMGDFAIKAVNSVYREKSGIKPIKPGPTYKIRKEVHACGGIRFFPSYTQTGDSFSIERSKRRMIAEDIKTALSYIEG